MLKAWELSYQLIQGATPVVLDEEEQTWKALEVVEKSNDFAAKLFWHSNVPGSGAPEKLAVAAVQSMYNMGYHTDHLDLLLQEGLAAYDQDNMPELHKLTARLFNEISKLKKDESSPYWKFTEYSEWEQYLGKVQLDTYDAYPVETEDFAAKINAGWVAQICAGAMGTAIEGYSTANLRKKFGEIRGYVRTPNTYNDDITYEIAFLKAFENKGYKVTSADIAEEWVAYVPSGWSAEEIALKNIRSGIYPPESGYLNNPFREWIGAQMRGAICGMVAPGDPKEAARLAWEDGIVSHANNGVLGEIFNAVLVSLAFVEKDVKVILDKTLAAIPQDSEYYSIVSSMLNLCKQHTDWESAWAIAEESLKEFNWIHAYPNAAAEVLALWYGNGDFDETMHVIAMAGQDVDCNAAQIATVLGIIHGVEAIGPQWTDPLGDELDTYIRTMKKMKISQLASLTTESTRKARQM